MKHYILLILICISFKTGFAQDNKKWGKEPIPYLKATDLHTATAHNNTSNLFIYLYHNLISEADGDRCPFAPTCSGFFIESVHKTNIVQGVLMFMDRFTRDANTVNHGLNYKYNYKVHHFDDPVSKYILN